MRVGIIGGGVVGSATAEAFRGFVDEVLVCDKDRSRGAVRLSDILDLCDLIFVCVPTPMNADGSCDTSIVDGVFNFKLGSAPLEAQARKKNFVLRSTVPIGYTRKARERFNLPNLVHSPEFLTGRTAVEDATNPKRMIVGYQPVEYEEMPQCARLVWLLYKNRWPQVPLFAMTSDESEFVKLMQNAHSADKIAIFNEFRAFADKMGMDWDRCLNALLAGGWINPAHTQVPGPDGKRGFGGACLEKDTANLIHCIEAAGLPATMTRAALARNEEDRHR